MGKNRKIDKNRLILLNLFLFIYVTHCPSIVYPKTKFQRQHHQRPELKICRQVSNYNGHGQQNTAWPTEHGPLDIGLDEKNQNSNNIAVPWGSFAHVGTTNNNNSNTNIHWTANRNQSDEDATKPNQPKRSFCPQNNDNKKPKSYKKKTNAKTKNQNKTKKTTALPNESAITVLVR